MYSPQYSSMNTPGQNSNAVAELAIGMMIYMSRNSFNPGTGSELKGKKLGIHAYGNVGKLAAKIAKDSEWKYMRSILLFPQKQ